MATIGFVGLGAMGSRMAANLLAAGHRVQGYNRDAARLAPLVAAGVHACATPREAARGASVTVAMVSDDEASDAVMHGEQGILAGAPPGSVIVDSTTATPAHARALWQSARDRGIGSVDAPVLGSLAQAANRELVFVVGGDPHDVELARPTLECMGRLVRRVGGPGAGATLKLVNNMVSGALTAALAEATAVAEAAGVDAAALVDILSEGAAGSRLTRSKLPKMSARDFTPQFQLALMEKDLRYFLALAEETSRPTPMARTAREIYAGAKRAELGALDSSAVFRWLYGQAAGQG